MQHLAAGATATDSFTVSSLDSTASQLVSVTINGANDPAAISGTAAASLGEDDTAPATGTLSVSDVDDGQAHTKVASGAGTAGLGSFSVDADGHWSYTLNNAAVQHLAAGATATDSFTVSSLDGTASQLVSVTINGANDPAAITGTAAASLGEDDTAPATGTLSVSDVDDGQAHTKVASGAGTAGLGSFSVDADGHWSYTLNNAAVQHLAAGATATDSFTVSSLDGTASQLVSVTINGANDPAAISGTAAASLGEDDTAPATGTLSVSDVDDGQAHTKVASGAGTAGLGSFSVDADGHWSYTLNNAAVQHLAAGATATDSFTVSSLDGTASQLVSVTINGANDPAAITGTAAASLGEDDTAPATGTLSVSDVDDGQAHTKVASGAGTAGLGSFSVDADGHWSYTLNNAAVQHLAAGATATDSFTVSSLDGTASQLVSVTINGANDPAAISGTAPASLGEDDTAPATGTLSVSDVDDGQAHTEVASGAGTAGLGSFSVDADGHWSYTLNNATVQHLAAGATATDSFTVSSLDGTASQLVSVTINGANDPAAISGTAPASLGERGGSGHRCPT